VVICYDFHFGISNEEEDLMFVIEKILFSIETIVVPTTVKLKQPINFIPSIGLNLIKHVLVELISILLV
jgi:hypothetical protein